MHLSLFSVHSYHVHTNLWDYQKRKKWEVKFSYGHFFHTHTHKYMGIHAYVHAYAQEMVLKRCCLFWQKLSERCRLYTKTLAELLLNSVPHSSLGTWSLSVPIRQFEVPIWRQVSLNSANLCVQCSNGCIDIVIEEVCFLPHVVEHK